MAGRLAASVQAMPEAIAALAERLLDFLEAEGVDARTTHHVTLIVDEILTNLGAHGGCRDEPAEVTITIGPDAVAGEIVDRGEPFDLRQAPGPDVDADLEKRVIGGLGLFLVHRLSSNLDYERRDGANHTRFMVSRR